MNPDGLAFVLRFPGECTEGVTRRDEFQPCDKPAVSVRIDPEESGPYPVCARHARGEMVPLADVIAAVRAQVAAEIDTLRTEHVSSYGPTFDDGFTSACEIAAARHEANGVPQVNR